MNSPTLKCFARHNLDRSWSRIYRGAGSNWLSARDIVPLAVRAT